MVALGEAEAAKQRAIALAQADATRAIGDAEASKARAVGLAEADAMRAQGEAQANTERAVGVGKAQGFEAQRAALGESATAIVNVIEAISRGDVKVVPDVLVGGGSPFDGLAAVLTKLVHDGGLGNGDVPSALEPSRTAS
jgi:uncharacterized membrane protein YqiK